MFTLKGVYLHIILRRSMFCMGNPVAVSTKRNGCVKFRNNVLKGVVHVNQV